ncbi:MAG TPA: thioredoxin family protein [Ferruginibacter sp.]|nr:thioredoxin family protein [Ferruginibacter sp.]
MKKIFGIFLCLVSINTLAQDTDKSLYHPEADAAKDIAAAVKQAKAEHKYVLLLGGGNWCSWCITFEKFCKEDATIDSVIRSAFVPYHLNYSKENENKKAFAKYGYAQRFGFPVFIILNEKGERIHTQNSEYLEDGKKSYDRARVQAFFEMWSPHALNPKMYGD